MSRKVLASLLLVLMATTSACGGGETPPPAPATETPATDTAMTPDLSQAGAVAGTVNFANAEQQTPPQAIQMAADPFCQSAHSEVVMRTPVMIDVNGGLMNAVVYVAAGLENYSFPVPTDAMLLDQVGCIYEPHVAVARTGQTVTFRNSDDTLHNVNVQPKNNPAFNEGQPLKGMTSDKVFANAEVGIPARCDVHPWMQAFLSVFDHPYFAVTAADGSFSLGQLPPGDYVVETWHETLGTLTQSVTVAPSTPASLTISFE